MCFRRPFDLPNPQSPEDLCIGATGARQESTQLKTQLDMNIEYSESTTASKYKIERILKSEPGDTLKQKQKTVTMINRYIRHHQTVVTRPWRLHYALMVHPPPTQICAGRQVCHFSERLSTAEHVSISCWLRNLCTTPSETMENDGNLPSKNRLLILPTYKPHKPLIFRNTLRCTDDQSSIKVNEGHKQCCVPMVLCLVKHSRKRWLQVARDLNLYNLLQDRGLDELDKQTDSLLSTIWWSKFVDV